MIKRLLLLMFFLVPGTFHLVQGVSSIHSLTLTAPALLQCGGNVIEARYTPVAIDSTGATITSFDATQVFVTSNSGALSLNERFTSGTSHTFYLSIGSETMAYAEVYLVSAENPVVRSNRVRINCDGTTQDLGSAVNATGETGLDDRLNPANGDLINVLYMRPDASGKSGIAVYSLDARSNGVLEGVFPNALFTRYRDNPPAENTYLGEIDHAKLYALTSGEFQITISDPLENKVYNTIFSPVN